MPQFALRESPSSESEDSKEVLSVSVWIWGGGGGVVNGRGNNAGKDKASWKHGRMGVETWWELGIGSHITKLCHQTA